MTPEDRTCQDCAEKTRSFKPCRQAGYGDICSGWHPKGTMRVWIDTMGEWAEEKLTEREPAE